MITSAADQRGRSIPLLPGRAQITAIISALGLAETTRVKDEHLGRFLGRPCTTQGLEAESPVPLPPISAKFAQEPGRSCEVLPALLQL